MFPLPHPPPATATSRPASPSIFPPSFPSFSHRLYAASLLPSIPPSFRARTSNVPPFTACRSQFDLPRTVSPRPCCRRWFYIFILRIRTPPNLTVFLAAHSSVCLHTDASTGRVKLLSLALASAYVRLNTFATPPESVILRPRLCLHRSPVFCAASKIFNSHLRSRSVGRIRGTRITTRFLIVIVS